MRNHSGTTSLSLNRRPPVDAPYCLPVLILNLAEWVVPYLGDVLRNDLLYSTTSTWMRSSNDQTLNDEVKLNILNFLDGPDLVVMTAAFGGSVMANETTFYGTEGNFIESKLDPYRSQSYQAIIVDDTSMVYEQSVATFVASQFHDCNVSVVVISVEGVYNLQPYLRYFDVDWKFAAYTKRYVKLTDFGEQILSRDVFTPDNLYTKASFIDGPSPLFMEYIDPSDYDQYDCFNENGTPPSPSPGSPVVCSIRDNYKSVSYYGFLVGPEVSCGSIVLRLCYAAKHASSSSSS